MIWSVSTLLRRSGTPTPVCATNGSMSDVLQVRGRREPTADRRRRRHRHRHQVRASALALPALEVAVGGGCAALAGLEGVRVHAEAHRATGTAPLGTGLLEDDVQALFL